MKIEKSVKDLFNYDLLSDLLIGLPNTNEYNVSLDIKIKVKKQIYIKQNSLILAS